MRILNYNQELLSPGLHYKLLVRTVEKKGVFVPEVLMMSRVTSRALADWPWATAFG